MGEDGEWSFARGQKVPKHYQGGENLIRSVRGGASHSLSVVGGAQAGRPRGRLVRERPHPLANSSLGDLCWGRNLA